MSIARRNEVTTEKYRRLGRPEVRCFGIQYDLLKPEANPCRNNQTTTNSAETTESTAESRYTEITAITA